ncbi:MAG: hypothetical protein J6A67_01405 [Clostridia bacterium]|nr:hypothetical protein [Clostridia bacterium]
MEKKNKNKNSKKQRKLSPLVESIIEEWETADEDGVFDALGSYTGTPEDGGVPIQDADDL